MPTNHKTTVTNDFFKAANKVVAAQRKAAREARLAEEARQAAAEQERLKREHEANLAERRRRQATNAANAKLKTELAPILNALVALPEKDGKKFRSLHPPRTYIERDGSYSITATLSYTFTNIHCVTGKVVFVNSAYKNGPETDKRFANARQDLGQWVGTVAPERMNELKKALTGKSRKPSR